VEDEAPVRELVCNLLTAHGYRVLQAASGVKALQVWRDNKDRVDLLLTDLVMPERLNGRELAETLWAERPKLKVIFTSVTARTWWGRTSCCAGLNLPSKALRSAETNRNGKRLPGCGELKRNSCQVLLVLAAERVRVAGMAQGYNYHNV